jgi:hypothetical protein
MGRRPLDVEVLGLVAFLFLPGFVLLGDYLFLPGVQSKCKLDVTRFNPQIRGS